MEPIRGGGGCFIGTTLVSVPGGQVPIEEVKENDIILSFDDKGKVHEARVLKVHRHEGEEVWEYRFWGGGSFTATPNHWVLNQFNAFVQVGTLGGDDCVVNQNGHLLPIIAKSKVGDQTVFNLTVEHQHTFIAENIRVHNAGLGLGVRGAGGGGGSKGGGGGHTPVEADDSLESVQYARVLDLLCEGPIEGLDNQAYPLNSVYLDGTPVQTSSGEDRFTSGSYRVIYDRRGTQNQAYITDLIGIEVPVPLGTNNTITRVNPPASATQQIGDGTNSTSIDRVRVTLSWPALQKFEDNGDINPSGTHFKIQIDYNGGGFNDVVNTSVVGKSSSSYQRDYIITPTPWNGNSGGSSNWPISIKVVRVSEDATNKNVSSINWTSYTKISDERLTYPNTALMFLRFDSKAFTNIPTRKYLIRALKVNIPHNGTVDTTTHLGRVTYSGLFDGTVNNLQWCSDPAWCLWDLLTNERYGCAIPASSLDAFDFYKISQYCNELVSDGKGGQEPRFSCNLIINSKAEVYNVINVMTSIFRGITYYGSGTLVTLQDKPADSQYLIGPANVVNGNFEYTGVSQKAKHTIATVAYQDYDSLGEVKYEYVEDATAIEKYGIIPKDVQAIGCYSQGQARRLGKWILLSEQNLTQTVTFSISIDSGIILRPGMVFDLADPTKAGRRRFGRIQSATTTSITVDSDTDLSSIDLSASPTISVLQKDGLVETKTITAIEAVNVRQIDISGSFSQAPQANSVWLVQTTGIQSQQFRVISVVESGNGQYGVTALEYNSTIYDAVEQDLKVEQRDVSDLNDAPGAVTGITGSQFLYQRGQGIFVGFNVSWNAPTTGGPASYFSVAWRFRSPANTGDYGNWTTETVTGITATINALGAGELQVKIQAHNYLGKGSATAQSTFILEGKTGEPGDVQNLTFESINANSGRLRWDQSTDLDVKVGGKIFIRHSNLTDGSATWGNSSDLIDAKAGNATEAVIPKVAGEILVKFEDSSGVRSLNAASVLISIAAKNQTLLIKNQREDQISPTPFSGSKTDCNYDASLDALELNSDGSGNVLTSGTYNFAETLDLSHIYALDLSRYFVIRGTFVTDLMDGWPDVDARPDWDGDVVDATNASLKIRTTDDDPTGSPTWSSWTVCANGTFQGRAFQFKTDLTSSSTNQNILVDQLGYTASLDQRTEQSVGTTASGTSAGGKAITFTNAFFTGTSALGGGTTAYLPSIGIVGQNIQSGDFYNVTNVSATGFTVKFENGGSTVDRNFTWTAVGFGRRV